LAEPTSEAWVEVVSAALARDRWRGWATITVALEDAVSLAAAFTTAASIARTTCQTPGRTTAHIDRVNPEISGERFSLAWAHLDQLAKGQFSG